MVIRALVRAEIERIWTLDRAERIERSYELRDGKLHLCTLPIEVSGWQSGTPEQLTPGLMACFDRGGDFTAAFAGEQVAGFVVLDRRAVTARPDLLQLRMLYVGRDFRHRGLGARLFRHAGERARLWGATGLYVSATPTENTIRFYLGRGCSLISQPDPELYAEEPEDIHLEWFPSSRLSRTTMLR